ncbi:hypothetical protein UA32_11825 [Photobacterium angustum]|uniref:Uncharacterized protein n=1 Tax=Photobacterium angustum TaxID=661 RepID=A0ABX5H251_PHOAN|nr:hypothetical protein [Photobacterium angustum]KJG37648.1 hypothetical protein UA32_11825 [Photobacterium angustum]PSX07105.1 hypothetical protein C0W27_16170 [Photobacterium angustum]
MKPCNLNSLDVFKNCYKNLEQVHQIKSRYHRFSNLDRYDVTSSSDSIKVDLLLQHAELGYIEKPFLLDALYQCSPDQKFRISRLLRLIDMSVNRYFKTMNNQLENELNLSSTQAPMEMCLDFFEKYITIEGVSIYSGFELEVTKFNLKQLSKQCQNHLYTVMNKLSTYGVFDLFSDQATYFYNFSSEVFEPCNGMSIDPNKLTDSLDYLLEFKESEEEDFDYDTWFNLYKKSFYFKERKLTQSDKCDLIEKYKTSLKPEIYNMFGEEFYQPFYEYCNLKQSEEILLTDTISVDKLKLDHNCTWQDIFDNLPKSRNKTDRQYLSILSHFREHLESLVSCQLEHDENGSSFVNSLCLYSSKNEEHISALSNCISSCEDDFANHQEHPSTTSTDAKVTNEYIKTFSVINALIGSLNLLQPKNIKH